MRRQVDRQGHFRVFSLMKRWKWLGGDSPVGSATNWPSIEIRHEFLLG
jgi:hypothetical protein